jgi:YidC/Oxa1 family membrane protein insertase
MGALISAIFKMFENMGIASLAGRIILFSVLLRIIIFPFDFLGTRAQRKTALAQAKIQPQLDKLKKKYPNDKQKLQTEQQKLNKAAGIKPLASCLPMLLPAVIMILVFSGFSPYTASQNAELFRSIHTVSQIDFFEEEGTPQDLVNREIPNFDLYEHEYFSRIYTLSGGDAQLVFDDIGQLKIVAIEKLEDGKSDVEQSAIKIEAMQFVVLTVFDTNRDSFLWIKNLSRPDTFWAKSVESYGDYLTSVKDNNTIPMTQSEYRFITEKINQKHARNGLLILPIISLGLQMLSMMLATRKNQAVAAGQNAKIMKIVQQFVMPIFIGIIALNYSSAFALYIVAGTATAIITRLIINLILSKTLKDGDGNKKGEEMQFDRTFRKA